MKRLLFVLIDGFGDLNVPSENDNHSFEDIFSKLNTPNLSKYFISGHGGYYGVWDPVEPGMACGSDTAHLSLFGFKPVKYYTGRGAFETIGTGLTMTLGEIAFKCNFAFVDESTHLVLKRRVDKYFASEARELCIYLQEELNKTDSYIAAEGITVTIKYATEHRCGIKIRKSNFNLSDEITGTDPLYDNLPLIRCQALRSEDLNASLTSDIVELVSNEITRLLLIHPINLKRKIQNKPIANVILFRGASRAPVLPKFDIFHGIVWDPIMMARTCIISGIGKELGFELSSKSNDNHITENNSTILEDLNAFIEELLEKDTCRFAFFHVKAVDEASHDHNLDYKMDLIEFIDEILKLTIENLIKKLGSDELRIVLTGDHTTLCRIGEHSCEPVPFLVSKPLIKDAIFEDFDISLKLSSCFINNNIGRFAGESIIEFLKYIVSNERIDKQ